MSPIDGMLSPERPREGARGEHETARESRMCVVTTITVGIKYQIYGLGIGITGFQV